MILPGAWDSGTALSLIFHIISGLWKSNLYPASQISGPQEKEWLAAMKKLL